MQMFAVEIPSLWGWVSRNIGRRGLGVCRCGFNDILSRRGDRGLMSIWGSLAASIHRRRESGSNLNNVNASSKVTIEF
jgi:hypothetical protein